MLQVHHGASHSVFARLRSFAIRRLAGLLRRQSRVPWACIPTEKGYIPGYGSSRHLAPARTLRRAARAVTAAYDAALAPSGLRITQFSILRKLARLGPLPVTRLAAEAALDRSTMGRNLNPLERRGLVRIEVGNVDQRERVAYLTAAGEAAIEAALPYWRKAQERIAALVQPSAIGELADQLDALGAREQIPT